MGSGWVESDHNCTRDPSFLSCSLETKDGVHTLVEFTPLVATPVVGSPEQTVAPSLLHTAGSSVRTVSTGRVDAPTRPVGTPVDGTTGPFTRTPSSGGEVPALHSFTCVCAREQGDFFQFPYIDGQVR